VSLYPPLANVLGTPLAVVDAGLETGWTAAGVDRYGSSFGVQTADDAGVAVRI
jgi:hypothetical protein